MDMIERVARALAAHDSEGAVSWEDCRTNVKDAYRSRARAAIEAMRNPNDAMNFAGAQVGDYPWDGKRPSRIFTAMIDAARTPAGE
jgi:hypothetical protein